LHGGDVARRVGRVDHDEGPIEGSFGVVFGIQFDRRTPVGRRLQDCPRRSERQNEEFEQVPRGPPGPEVAAVHADPPAELLEHADLGGQFRREALLDVGGMEGRPVDGGLDRAGSVDIVTGDEVHVEPIDGAGDIGVFGVLLAAIGEDGVADLETVRLQFLPCEVRRKPHEKVDVAPAREPGVPGGGADPERVGLDWEVGDGLAGAFEQGIDGGFEALALRGVGLDSLKHVSGDGLELRHERGVHAGARKGYRSDTRGNESPMN
jgi:hypothetical protein